MRYESFVFYRSFAEAMKELPPEEYKDVMIAIADYALDGTVPEGLTAVCKAFFTLCKPQIDANNTRRESGRKGGKANTSKPEANVKQTQAKAKQPEANVNVNDNVNIIHSKECIDPDLDAAIKDYINHRKKIKAPLTDRALDLAIKKLEELAPGNTALKVEIINQTIMNGWKGLFQLKNSTAGTYRNEDLDGQLIAGIQNRNRTAPVVSDWGAYFETG